MPAVPGYSGLVSDSASVSAGMILGWQTESAPSHRLCLKALQYNKTSFQVSWHSIICYKQNVHYGVGLNIIIL